MTTKTIFIFSGLIAVIAWLFLSGGEPETNKSEETISIDEGAIKGSVGNNNPIPSVIQPIKVVEITDNTEIAAQVSKEDRAQAQVQFNKATELVRDRQWQKAETIYLDLINKFPLVIGPYINLSAIYAQTNRVDDARKVLLQGLKANENYDVLFGNLQSIHGALAAEAYRAALITDETKTAEQANLAQLNLPIIDSIDQRLVDISKQQQLANQLDVLQTEQQSQQNSQARITQLESELSALNETTLGTNLDSANKIASLELQLKDLQAQLTTRSADLAVAQKELINIKLASAEVVAQSQSQEVTSQLAVVTNLPPADQGVNEVESKIELAEKEVIAVTSNLVKKWAESWSQQDVGRYISHYVSDYSPPRTEMTHREWADQRQVRLTNKKFIKVDVTNFQFEEDGVNQFSVTFTQRYRSNTIDDTVRKKLVFAKNDASFLQAKIIDEQIVAD